MYELIVANKTTGEAWELSNCTIQVQLDTHRTGSPAKLTFSYINNGDVNFEEGDIVRFTSNDTMEFYGFVFTRSFDRYNVIEVTCYDRLRYLKANASYAFYGQKASDILTQIAADLQINVGAIADTVYQIPSLIESEKACIDIIQDALAQTLLNTGKLYTLYDDGNGLSLRDSGTWFTNIIIGDESLLTDYSYKNDIDNDVYNSIKLVQPNKETGRNDVVIVQDSANIGKWGLLQLYQSIDGTANTAQMTAQAQESLKYYNQVRKTLSISSLGIDGLKAGMMMRIIISDRDIDSIVLLDSVSHTWVNDDHTMEIETTRF